MADEPAASLRPGVDYPRTLAEFHKFFPDEAACHRYLEQLRWPRGFVCPGCAAAGPAWRSERGLLVCPKCRRHVSIIAGTLFEGTRKPLREWFLAAWAVTSQKHGASALGMQRVLGLGSYKTAWAWLHKLRRAMVRSGRDRLKGEVEVDEVFVGGVEKGAGRRHLGNKALVAVAAQVDGDGIGRIRLKRIANSSAESLRPFIESAVEPGSTVITDGWQAYDHLTKAGYRHRSHTRGPNPARASKLLPRVHRVASLLKRWLLGTHQGAVSREHLDEYLNEFTFRFNRRTSRARGLLFYRLLSQAVQMNPAPTATLFLHIGRGPEQNRRKGRSHKM